ncbi:MAG: alpha-amylase/4-alpha-glucanotransferase domain-containing protein [Alkalispirochaetaceae bacterium]
MSRVYLILGASSCQPQGAADGEMEAVYDKQYKPFLRLLYNYPSVRFTLHYSGIVLNWIEKNHSEFTDVLAEMTARKQVELIGGAFFDPIIPLIPKQDRLGQIEAMTAFLRKRFGRRPRGAWITEGIWDQPLASNLSSCGIEYTFLDAMSFHRSDGYLDDYTLPCLTEDEGKTVTVFPIHRDLEEQMLAGVDPVLFLERLRERAYGVEGAVFTFLPDGNLIDLGWFEKLLKELEGNKEWFDVVRPGYYHRTMIPSRRIYFQTSSQGELLTWIKPEESDGSATYRRLLTMYPESNLLYSKMQYTHVLVNQVRGDKSRKLSAREDLWRGQAHHAYWLNPSGGIYRNELRKSAYAALIEAEKTTRQKGIFIPSIVRVDFDMDGREEYLYQGQEVNAYLHLKGGTLFELDHLRKPWNYLDTMSRRPEPFHGSEVETIGYDLHQRNAFVDRFLPLGSSLESFAAGRFEELGSFVETPYEVGDLDKDHGTISFTREGSVRTEGEELPVLVEKGYAFNRSGLSVSYTITNRGQEPLESRFAPEVNLSFRSAEVEDLRILVRERGSRAAERAPEATEFPDALDVQFNDLFCGASITLAPEGKATFWSFPVYTVGRGSTGVLAYYSANCVLPLYDLSLPPGESWSTTLKLSIKTL